MIPQAGDLGRYLATHPSASGEPCLGAQDFFGITAAPTWATLWCGVRPPARITLHSPSSRHQRSGTSSRRFRERQLARQHVVPPIVLVESGPPDAHPTRPPKCAQASEGPIRIHTGSCCCSGLSLPAAGLHPSSTPGVRDPPAGSDRGALDGWLGCRSRRAPATPGRVRVATASARAAA